MGAVSELSSLSDAYSPSKTAIAPLRSRRDWRIDKKRWVQYTAMSSSEDELSSELAEIDLNRCQRSDGAAVNAIRGEGNPDQP